MTAPTTAPGGRSWLRFALATAGVLALLAFIALWWMNSNWATLESVTPHEAGAAFDEALAGAGDGPAYVTIGDDGVRVERTLEHAAPTALTTLSVLIWSPSAGDLLRLDFPFWFVRLKSSSVFNLGTAFSILSEDWDGLDLDITAEDLERRGPGLVLDHTSARGERVVMWCSRKP